MIGHAPVLLDEVVEQLAISGGGIYVDATFGRGGHSEAILASLGPDGRLFAMDRDPAARDAAQPMAARDSRFIFEQENFGRLSNFLDSQQINGRVDGLLIDLGVSSPQLDDASRGFSFMADGPLDMRMNPERGVSAAEWLAAASEDEIARVIARYGEERAARRIARAICAQREQQPLATTGELAALIERVVRRQPGGKHPATKTFQAIRLHVNDELAELDAVLPQAMDALAPGGRLCIISFHSLEDRRVKRFMRDHSRVDPSLLRLPTIPESAQPRFRLPTRAIRASAAELERNPRARSATLRVAERC